MPQLTPFDEYLIHQTPLPIAEVSVHHPHWRESHFFDLHDPSGDGDCLFFTWAVYPHERQVDSLQMGRVDGARVGARLARPSGDEPHATVMPGARIEIVEPWQEVRLFSDPAVSAVGVDVTFRARTKPYALRRGTMVAGQEVIWDQSHLLQSGTYEGTYTVGGVTKSVDGWIGQRDHSWGIRDHARCPLWLWFQIQLDDGMIGVWHWELSNGARIYTDGCWVPTDGGDAVALVGFDTDVEWLGADRAPVPYGQHGDQVWGLGGRSTLRFADGRTIVIDAEGTFARPYEPSRRGGLNLMKVRTDDGRVGRAIYEVTGARHHRWFPECEVPGTLPG